MSFVALWLAAVSFGTAVSIAFANPRVVNPANIFNNNANAADIFSDINDDFESVIDTADTLNLDFNNNGYMQKLPHKNIKIVREEQKTKNIKTEKTKVSQYAATRSIRSNAEYTKSGGALPVMIKIPALGKTLKVRNPSSTKISELNKGLKKAVLRYPGTGYLNENSRNMIIFGHSSHLPTDMVFNKMYRAFNGIEKLKYGSVIKLYNNSGRVYQYKVVKVIKVKASHARIPINTSKKTLTLITCDNFGAKEDRWVVTATAI